VFHHSPGQLEYLDTNDLKKEQPVLRTVSQFEMSMDTIHGMSMKVLQFNPTKVESSCRFEPPQPSSPFPPSVGRNFGLPQAQTTMSAKGDAFAHRLAATAPLIRTFLQPKCPELSSPSLDKPSFSRSILFNGRTDKRPTGDSDSRLRDFRQNYSKRYFNTGIYEYKASRRGRRDIYNNLKLVMSDVVNSDFTDTSGADDPLRTDPPSKARVRNDLRNNHSAHRLQDSGTGTRFSKTSTTSLMANSDLQRILALNNKIYSKAKQLIKF
jgi:hypothetical protein